MFTAATCWFHGRCRWEHNTSPMVWQEQKSTQCKCKLNRHILDYPHHHWLNNMKIIVVFPRYFHFPPLFCFSSVIFSENDCVKRFTQVWDTMIIESAVNVRISHSRYASKFTFHCCFGLFWICLCFLSSQECVWRTVIQTLV